MKEVVIVSGSRTAIGTFGGGLKDIPAIELGAVVMQDVLKRVNLKPVANETMKGAAPDKLKDQGLTELEKKTYDWSKDALPVTVDEVIMGNVFSHHAGACRCGSGRGSGKHEPGSDGATQSPLGPQDGADRRRRYLRFDGF
jgi:acetyl-CoA acetyltransferase